MGRDLSRRVIKQLSLENVPEYNGTAVAPAGVPFLTNLKERLSAVLRRRPAAETEAPKVDETPDESALVSALHRPRQCDPRGRQPARGYHIHRARPDVRRPRGQHAGGRVRRPEPGREASGHAEHDRLARAGSEQAAGQGSGERARPRRLPRAAERPVARRQAEHRPLPAQQAERRCDELEDQEGAETGPLQSDQSRSPPVSRPKPFPPSRSPARSRSAKARVIDAQRTRAALAERYGEKHPDLVKASGDLQEAQRQYEVEVSRAVQLDQERLRHRPSRRTDDDRCVGRGKGRRAGPEHEERQLQRDGARGQQQPAGVRVAAPARQRAASVEQQPLEQRARRSITPRYRRARWRPRVAGPGCCRSASASYWRSGWPTASTT